MKRLKRELGTLRVVITSAEHELSMWGQPSHYPRGLSQSQAPWFNLTPWHGLAERPPNQGSGICILELCVCVEMCCVTLGPSLSLSGPQFLHLKFSGLGWISSFQSGLKRELKSLGETLKTRILGLHLCLLPRKLHPLYLEISDASIKCAWIIWPLNHDLLWFLCSW